MAVRGGLGGGGGRAQEARPGRRPPDRPRLGLPPGQIVYLGDTNTDMQTAVAAGMYPVGALWGFRTASELTASGAQGAPGEADGPAGTPQWSVISGLPPRIGFSVARG